MRDLFSGLFYGKFRFVCLVALLVISIIVLGLFIFDIVEVIVALTAPENLSLFLLPANIILISFAVVEIVSIVLLIKFRKY